jgi:hypothetical protein
MRRPFANQFFALLILLVTVHGLTPILDCKFDAETKSFSTLDPKNGAELRFIIPASFNDDKLLKKQQGLFSTLVEEDAV